MTADTATMPTGVWTACLDCRRTAQRWFGIIRSSTMASARSRRRSFKCARTICGLAHLASLRQPEPQPSGGAGSARHLLQRFARLQPCPGPERRERGDDAGSIARRQNRGISGHALLRPSRRHRNVVRSERVAVPKHVLIVEDDAAIRGTLEDVLQAEGYAVSVANSGVEALAHMRRYQPDLMLLDLMLPDMNGWTLLQLREGQRELARIPVLVISAAGPAGVAEAQELGAPVYLAKPFNLDDLLREIERLCAGPVRQCAWCGQVMDESGEFRLRSGRKLRWASHGICPVCKEKERQDLVN